MKRSGNSLALQWAEKLYLATSPKPLRRLYWVAFCALMRKRRVTKSIEGIIYDLDLSEIIDLSLYLNKFELDVVQAIKELARPGATVLDVGANVGAHTLRLASLVGDSGRVFAFEPTAYAYQKLLRNIDLNKKRNISAIKLALSNRSERGKEVFFRSSWPTSGRSSIARDIVDFRCLDEWCAENAVDSVDVIKLDVDGHEFGVLDGAKTLLTRSKPALITEVTWPHFQKESENPLSFLHRLGYKFWFAANGEPCPSIKELQALFPEHDSELSTSFNIVALAQTGDGWSSSHFFRTTSQASKLGRRGE